MSMSPISTGSDAELPRGWRATVGDFYALTKPTIVVMCLMMCVAGMWLAADGVGGLTALATLLGTALAVGAANALNMYIEREVDGRMHRTRHRPLPAGRLPPVAALIFGIGLGALSLCVLGFVVNGLSALLAALAIISYALLYTPLKQHSHWALWVGAIPGAMPPLIGWTAATGRIELPGLLLFATVVLWQIPHFLAIALYSQADYRRGGIRAVPLELGERTARRQAKATAALLLPVSLLLVVVGPAGLLYGAIAAAIGGYFLFIGLTRLTERAGLAGARRFFFASLIYLPVLGGALLADVLTRT